MKHLVAPSILSCDFARLGEEIDMINKSRAAWIHVDIMDGIFVPNISIGLPVVEAIHRHADKPLDVHLMIAEPDRYVEAFQRAGASIISIHPEADIHMHRTVQHIKKRNCKAGVALNPHTPVAALADLLHEIDLVCLMAVNPGFGGQRFIDHTYAKIRELKALMEDKKTQVQIEIDGGVTLDNAADLVRAGADVLVAGSTVFSSESPIHTIERLSAV